MILQLVCDCTSVVCSAVDIVDRNRLGEGTCGYVISFAHSMLMKHPVVLQSMRACVHHLTTVSVDSISASTRRDIGPKLAAMMYLTGNRHSQAGRRLCRFGMGGLSGDTSGSADVSKYL
jgi:hypothetical protein